jgi:DNA-binding NarL/FixJ family response regulator
MAAMTAEGRIRVLSVDDHPLLNEGIAGIIGAQPDMELVAQATTAGEGLRLYRECRPDVTLLDVRLPDMSGIDLLTAIRAEFVNARIVMLSTFQGDAEIQRALKAGARGFLLKNMPNRALVQGIRRVHSGIKYIPPDVAAHLAEYMTDDDLTTREVEVLRLVGTGRSNRDIADVLSISEDTIKGHVSRIMEKLGAHDRTEAVVIGVRRGIIQI